jgi:type IV pilus assembly protein PilC
MPAFEYQGRNSEGRTVTGRITADDREAAEQQLASQGLEILMLTRAETAASQLQGKMNADDFIHFNRHLASIMKTDAPLNEAMRAIITDMDSGRFQMAIESVANDIENGRSFSEALQQRDDVFSGLYISMVRAGETSGDLAGILTMIAEQTEGIHKVRQKIIEALIYPSIVMVAAASIYLYLAINIVPNFKTTYDEMGIEIPKMTQLVFMLSSNPIPYYLSCLIIIPIVFLWVAGGTTVGREILDAVARAVPLFNTIGESYALSRICTSLAMLLKGGVPVNDALIVAAAMAPSTRWRSALLRTSELIEEGESLSDALQSVRVFPRSLCWMLSMGEKARSLPESLGTSAEFHESRATRAASLLDIMFVPVIVYILGILIGGTVFSLFLPLINLMEAMGG